MRLQKQELGKDACQPQGFYGPLTKDDVKVRLTKAAAWLQDSQLAGGGGAAGCTACPCMNRAAEQVMNRAAERGQHTPVVLSVQQCTE